jgi:hypothetical protein
MFVEGGLDRTFWRMVFKSLSSEELANLIVILESSVKSRNGYDIKCDGSCHKGPQGLWWNVAIEFESELDSIAFREVWLLQSPKKDRSVEAV